MTDETTAEQPPRMVGMNGEPAGIRSFPMNSPEFYEATADPEERPWIPNGSLPREPRWPRRPSPVHVWSQDGNDDPNDIFRDWQWRLDTGRIGTQVNKKSQDEPSDLR